MIRDLRQSSGVWRHVFMTLATIAIVLKVMIPPGFMTGTPADGMAFPLVICTGQGAMVIMPGAALAGHDQHGKAPSRPHDSPCVFAGHRLGAEPPSVFDAGVVEFIAYRIRPQAAVADLAPGRGLTGPPLPARGPPGLLI